jgi:hypothetical protein
MNCTVRLGKSGWSQFAVEEYKFHTATQEENASRQRFLLA